jgi:hypothetical protein
MWFVGDRPLPVSAWLAIPAVFIGIVLGVVSTAATLLNMAWPVIATPELLGAAVALTAVSTPLVGWHSAMQRHALKAPYPVAIMVFTLLTGGFSVPAPIGILIGLPSLVAGIGLYGPTRRESHAHHTRVPVS